MRLNENGDVILHERLDRMLAFDETRGLLDAEAGVSFDDLLRTFLPRGWFPPVTPGTKFVTLGGAIAADVHGKNHHADGSIANFVQDLHLLTAGGDVLRCARDENAEALGHPRRHGPHRRDPVRPPAAPARGIGVRHRRHAAGDEPRARARPVRVERRARHRYSVAWIDCLATGDALGRSVLMGGDHATVAELPPACTTGRWRLRRAREGRALFLPSFANPTTVKAFNARYYRLHRDGRRVVDHETFFYPLDAVRALEPHLRPARGFLQYQVVLPRAAGRAGLAQLLERLAASRRRVVPGGAEGDRAAGAGDALVPARGYTLALDLPNTGPDVVAFLRSLDEIVLGHGGRVYLAKDAATTADSLARMYPNLPRFLDVKRRLDPTPVHLVPPRGDSASRPR